MNDKSSCILISPIATEVVELDQAHKNLQQALTQLMEGNDVDAAQNEFDKWDKYVCNHPEHIKVCALKQVSKLATSPQASRVPARTSTHRPRRRNAKPGWNRTVQSQRQHYD